ncbi:MAG: acyltransferase family protein [Promethearchaeota archaeon]
MKTQRLKSIDVFRGACMAWMILTHLLDWWLTPEFSWLQTLAIMIIDPIGASGFLFISGVSLTISHRNRLKRARESEDYTYNMLRNSYFFRVLFIFIVAIIYNIPTAILLGPAMLWTWYVLLTASVSIFLAWPLLKTPKLFRIFVTIFILVIHFSIVSWLLGFQGETNLLGFVFHILYNDIHQDPLLIFFPFFIIGTVVGDLINDNYFSNDNCSQNSTFKKKLLVPVIIVGFLMIITGISIFFPNFLIRESLSWVIYSMGIELCLFSILLAIEKYKIIETKRSYKLFFYYSYYSLTIYLAHNLLYFLFLNLLDDMSIWFFAISSFFIIGFILRWIYKNFKEKASLKVQIGRLSQALAQKIEAKKIREISKIHYERKN